MAIELDQVLSDFATVAERLGLPGWPAAHETRVISLGSDGESGNAWRLDLATIRSSAGDGDMLGR